MIVCYDWCLLLSLSSLLAGALFLLSSSLFTRAAVITCDYLHSVPPAGLFTRMQLSVALKPLHCSVPAPFLLLFHSFVCFMQVSTCLQASQTILFPVVSFHITSCTLFLLSLCYRVLGFLHLEGKEFSKETENIKSNLLEIEVGCP